MAEDHDAVRAIVVVLPPDFIEATRETRTLGLACERHGPWTDGVVLSPDRGRRYQIQMQTHR